MASSTLFTNSSHEENNPQNPLHGLLHAVAGPRTNNKNPTSLFRRSLEKEMSCDATPDAQALIKLHTYCSANQVTKQQVKEAASSLGIEKEPKVITAIASLATLNPNDEDTSQNNPNAH